MSSIADAIKDLLKFWIIKNVDTGDRTFDGLIHVVLIAGVSLVFTSFVYLYTEFSFSSCKIKMKILCNKMCCCCKYKINIDITQKNYEYFSKIAITKDFSKFK
jgi:hypothetical protein